MVIKRMCSTDHSTHLPAFRKGLLRATPVLAPEMNSITAFEGLAIQALEAV